MKKVAAVLEDIHLSVALTVFGLADVMSEFPT